MENVSKKANDREAESVQQRCWGSARADPLGSRTGLIQAAACLLDWLRSEAAQRYGSVEMPGSCAIQRAV